MGVAECMRFARLSGSTTFRALLMKSLLGVFLPRLLTSLEDALLTNHLEQRVLGETESRHKENWFTS